MSSIKELRVERRQAQNDKGFSLLKARISKLGLINFIKVDDLERFNNNITYAREIKTW